MPEFNYNNLQDNLISWVTFEENVRALLLVGSRARSQPQHDKYSDLDTILFCLNPRLYVESNSWLRSLGPFWFSYLETDGEPEQYALYDGYIKIDVMLISIASTESLQSRLNPFIYDQVLQRGFKVLVDKTASQSQVIIDERKNEHKYPDQKIFENHLYQGLLRVTTCARYLQRNDLWRANDLLNGTLRNNLLTLMEWEALANHPTTDTWYKGRFINQWGNKEIISRFPKMFGVYHKEEQQLALITFMQVFSRLAEKIAAFYHLTFPEEDIRRIIEYLKMF